MIIIIIVMWVYTFWDGLYISKFKVKNKKELYDRGNDLLLTSLKEGHSLKYQALVYKKFLDQLCDRKLRKESIWRSDHNFGIMCLMALIKLNYVEEQDDPERGLYFPRRKKSRSPKQIETAHHHLCQVL